MRQSNLDWSLGFTIKATGLISSMVILLVSPKWLVDGLSLGIDNPMGLYNSIFHAESVAKDTDKKDDAIAYPSDFSPQAKAFLEMISYAEGTPGDSGYKVLFGGKKFDDFSQHPNQCINFFDTRFDKQNCSTAAGKWQIINKTFWKLQKDLDLPDFSPQSQQIAAFELLKRTGAVDELEKGNFDKAVFLASREWASLPGSDSQQPQKSLDELKNKYQELLQQP